MVKVRGQNSNRNAVKRTAENGQTIAGDEDAAKITPLLPGVKYSRLEKGLEFNRTSFFCKRIFILKVRRYETAMRKKKIKKAICKDTKIRMCVCVCVC